jgi:ribose transport system substrate-binding protein
MMVRARGKLIFVPLLLALIAVPTVLANAGGKTKTAPTTRSQKTALPDLAYVRAQIAKYKRPTAYTAPGPPFDAKKARGKTIFNVTYSSTIPFIQAIDDSEAAIAKQVGIKWIQFNTVGGPTEWSKGIDQAIAQKVDAIQLHADIRGLAPALGRAKKAGIPVFARHYLSPGVPPPLPKAQFKRLLFPAQAYSPGLTAARLDADYTILKTRGKADVVVITANDIYILQFWVKALRDEFAKRCGPGCKLKVLNVPVADWATKMQTEVQSALLKDANVNWIIPVIDGMVQFVVPGVRAAGKQGRVQIATYNGSTFALKDIQDKNIVAMDVGDDARYIGAINMDIIMRYLTGHPSKSRISKVRVFDAQNVRLAGVPPQVGKGYGNAYLRFRTLWRLK